MEGEDEDDVVTYDCNVNSNKSTVGDTDSDSANDSEEQEVDNEITVYDQVSYTDNF